MIPSPLTNLEDRVTLFTMRLLCKVGPYAGQVLTYPKAVGEALLATGQAELPPEATERPPVEVADAPPVEVPEWGLKTSPEEYLKRRPEGKQAAIARRILGEE